MLDKFEAAELDRTHSDVVQSDSETSLWAGESRVWMDGLMFEGI